MSFTMNSLVKTDKVVTGFVVVSTSFVDSTVFQADCNGKPVDWQPLDSYYFGDGDDDLEIHHGLLTKWGGR